MGLVGELFLFGYILLSIWLVYVNVLWSQRYMGQRRFVRQENLQVHFSFDIYLDPATRPDVQLKWQPRCARA